MFCSHHHKTKISSSDVKMRRVTATEMLKKCVISKQWPITGAEFTSPALLSRPALLINPAEAGACSSGCQGLNYFHKVLRHATCVCERFILLCLSHCCDCVNIRIFMNLCMNSIKPISVTYFSQICLTGLLP